VSQKKLPNNTIGILRPRLFDYPRDIRVSMAMSIILFIEKSGRLDEMQNLALDWL
jgi:hypothetical protein